MKRLLPTLPAILALWCAPALAQDCVPQTEAVAHMQTRDIRIEKSDGTVVTSTARIADERSEQLAGFQYLCPSPTQPPMLFVFTTEILTAFHMHNVHLALDIAFIAADGRFLEVMRMEPGSRLYAPRHRFRYALEAPAGTFARLGLTGGAARLLVAASSEPGNGQ
jgi:uncharacterized membrane protein (UPF0127 family)